MTQIRAAQPGPKFEVATRLQALVTDDPDLGRDRFRYYFAPDYANPVYNRFLASAGYEREAEDLLLAARAGDWKAARAALSDRVVDEVAVIGTADKSRDRIDELIEAGIETPRCGACPPIPRSSTPPTRRWLLFALGPGHDRSA